VSFPRDTYIYQYHIDLGVLPPDAERTLPIHPLQLYFVGAGLLITLVALWLHPRKRYDGEVALVALVLFSTSTAALEFLRADAQPRVYWGLLPQLTWMALAMSTVSIAVLAAAELVHRRRGRSRQPARSAVPAPPQRVPSDAT
jgi:prolipoprotein diacylglyceryltransferase